LALVGLHVSEIMDLVGWKRSRVALRYAAAKLAKSKTVKKKKHGEGKNVYYITSNSRIDRSIEVKLVIGKK